MRISLRLGLRAAAIVAVHALASPAQADVATCTAASEHAQELRNAGQLRAARAALRNCMAPDCPAAVRADCAAFLREVEASLPSIVISARDRRGQDLARAIVTLDGEFVTNALDGKAFSVDPGPHRLRVAIAGLPPGDRDIIVQQGEKNRVIRVTFGAPDSAPPVTSPDTRAHASGGIPTISYVLAGVGAIGLAGTAYYRIQLVNDVNELRATCAPHCTTDDRDRLSHEEVMANVALAIGLGALAAAAAVWLLSDASSSTAAARARDLASMRLRF